MPSFLVVVPFSGKAFHIDDTYYLAVANHILKDPLRPYSFEFDWGQRPELVFDNDNSPPFVQYWIAIFLKIFGPQEIPLHLAMLPFTVLAIGSMLWLSHRHLKSPLLATLTFAFSPAFIPSHNIMLDIPLVGLSLTSIVTFISGLEKNCWKRLIAAGTFAGLAILTKYSALVLLPLLIFYAMIRKRYRTIWYLCIPLCFLGLWAFHGYWFHGRPHFLGRSSLRSEFTFYEHIQASARCIAACFFPAFLMIGMRWRLRWLLVFIVSLGLSLTVNWPWKGPLIQYFLEAILFLNLVVLLSVLICSLRSCLNNRRRRERASSQKLEDSFLLLWIFGFLLFYLLFAEFVAVRHFLLILPPVVILGFKWLENQSSEVSKWRLWLAHALTLGITSIMGLLVAVTDVEQANVFRTQSARIAEELKSHDGQVWFVGHWGWQFYAQKNGFIPMNLDKPPLPTGTLLILPVGIHRQHPEVKQHFLEIKRFEIPGRSPLRTLNPMARANFYATYGDILPYTFSSMPLQIFILYKAG